MNRIYRLYREEGLTVRKRRARRRAVGTRAPILVEAKAECALVLDFVHDQFASGRRFRILNIVDDVTRECLAAIPDTSISGRRVARELTTLIERRGKPGMIVSDNGTEFTSNAMLSWCERQQDRLALHRAGQADAERLLRELQRPHARRAAQRDAVLRPRPRAGRRSRAWVSDYNHRRPHSSLGYSTPADYAANLTATGDRLRNPDQLRRSPVAHTRATRRTTRRDSNRRWMKVQGQVIAASPGTTLTSGSRGRPPPKAPCCRTRTANGRGCAIWRRFSRKVGRMKRIAVTGLTGQVVSSLIEAAGATLLYLPPYSPDVNPIEKGSQNSRPCCARPQSEPSTRYGTGSACC